MLPVNYFKTRLGTWLLLILVPVAGLQRAEAGESRYDRTIRALQAAEPEWRSDFAGIALWQLAGAYGAEAELARQDMQRRSGGAEVRTNRPWSSAVAQYASRLSAFQRRVEEGAAVSFDVSPVTEAVVQVDGEQVMLAHPRPQRQAAFEQSVLEQFCQLRDCRSLTGLAAHAGSTDLTERADAAIAVVGERSWAKGADAPRASAAPVLLKTGWEFTTDATVCTYGGIRLRFLQGDNPGAVRKLCLDLFAEIAALRDALLQQQQYGVAMDWSALAFGQTAGDGIKAVLRLNRSGDLLTLEAPLLRDHPVLLHGLVPWLSAQVSGQEATLELQAGAYGWRGAALDRYR